MRMAKVPIGELTIVAGLPGSGKSEGLDFWRRRITGLVVHDFHKDAHKNSPAVRDSLHFQAVVEALKAGHDCIIADIRFCETPRRQAIETEFRKEGFADFRYVFFENAPEKCEANIIRRNSEHRDSELRKLKELTVAYQIPEGTATWPVWQESPWKDVTE